MTRGICRRIRTIHDQGGREYGSFWSGWHHWRRAGVAYCRCVYCPGRPTPLPILGRPTHSPFLSCIWGASRMFSSPSGSRSHDAHLTRCTLMTMHTRCTLMTMHTYRWRGCGAGIDGHSRIDGTKRREVDKDRFHLTWRDTSYQSCSRNRRGCDGVQCMGHVQEARVQGNDSKSPTPRTRRIRQTCRGTQPKIGRLYVRMAIGVRT